MTNSIFIFLTYDAFRGNTSHWTWKTKRLSPSLRTVTSSPLGALRRSALYGTDRKLGLLLILKSLIPRRVRSQCYCFHDQGSVVVNNATLSGVVRFDHCPNRFLTRRSDRNAISVTKSETLICRNLRNVIFRTPDGFLVYIHL